jgi:beta-lactamase regulating signal transducer with metallopeptidase domain
MAMGSPISGLSPPVLFALGWALLHFLWQGAAIAALAAAVLQTCRQAQARYLIGLGALAAMLAAPVITFFFLNGNDAVPAFAGVPHVALSPTLLSWLVLGWICGVGIFASRFAAGLLLLTHGPRRRSRDAGAQLLALCHQVQEKLGITRVVRYLESPWLAAPASFGVLRPVVLLPVAALIGLSEEQLRAVIAHELAHVRRWDFAVNLFQTMVETLLFYHPAIWWLNKRICAEREICCDRIAVEASGNRLAYARALMALAEKQAAPSLAMAINRGPLTERITRLLGGETFDLRGFAVAMAASLLLLLASLGGGDLLLTASRPASHAARLPVLTGARYVPERMPAAALIQSQPKFVASAIHPRMHRSSLPLPPLPPAATLAKDAIVEADPVPVSPDPPAFPPLMPVPVADRYPAPLLPIQAQHNVFEWEQPEVVHYCDQYAQQIVTQGAGKPLLVDDAAKGRYAFFYYHCMLRNGHRALLNSDQGPVYMPLGSASANDPANAAGPWAISFAPFPAARSCSFAQAGNTLSGVCSRSEGSGTARGVVDGRQVRWAWTYLDDQKMPEELDFIGLIGADGAITGQAILIDASGRESIRAFSAHPGALITQVASQK